MVIIDIGSISSSVSVGLSIFSARRGVVDVRAGHQMCARVYVIVIDAAVIIVVIMIIISVLLVVKWYHKYCYSAYRGGGYAEFEVVEVLLRWKCDVNGKDRVLARRARKQDFSWSSHLQDTHRPPKGIRKGGSGTNITLGGSTGAQEYLISD